MSSSFLSELHWRFATKSFNSSQKISAEHFQKILDAIRLSPSSFGLQPYHVHIVEDLALREQIKAHSWNQSQVTDASHLLVFSSRADMHPDRINSYLETASQGNGEVKEKMKPYEEIMKGFFDAMPKDRQLHWAHRQTYIALGFAMAACAELHIDSCPMEGFDPQKIDEVLSLPAYLKSVVMLSIGYRAANPERPKIRFSEEDLFTRE